VAEKCIPVTDEEDLEEELAPYERKIFKRVSTNRITVIFIRFMLLMVQSG
jgi:hypothetical protein